MRKRINFLVGFLVLVVVGAIVPSLIARVRQAAEDTQCRNNLRQLGLAVHNSYDTYHHFPMASVRSPTLLCQERLSWYVDLAPFVEQWGIQFDMSKPWDSEENLSPRCLPGVGAREFTAEHRAPIGAFKVLICPSNPKHSDESPGLTNYVGISGLGEGSAELDKDYPGVGMLGCERKLKFEDITDGASNTMMIAETSWENGPWTAGGFPTVRGLAFNGMPYFGKKAQFCAVHRRSVLSNGPMLTNVVFADGSVRSFAETIDPRAFEAMATIAGGESVDLTGLEVSR
jgi:prepilin-type processing-associated H-X9-DG protein